ncbi:MAG: TetR family transcriptional regulator [Cyclobacteriaceae bacterium]|nr:TetR family transcriptional regulator [Cyclobacteriaceae bacterium]
MAIVSFRLTDALFLRDPQSTELGQKIVNSSVHLIDNLGFDQFTFKKLAEEINSTEASIYRYFENKHRLLLYLLDWYWTWVDYKFDLHTNNITDARERLSICIKILTEEKKDDVLTTAMDANALQRIIISEFEKSYLTKQVDADNRDGVFLPFKKVCHKIAQIVKEINPEYPYPHALVSTLVLSATHQLYYAEHLPSLTDIKFQPTTHYSQLHTFINQLALSALQS